jgi:hypothetical protein
LKQINILNAFGTCLLEGSFGAHPTLFFANEVKKLCSKVLKSRTKLAVRREISSQFGSATFKQKK